MGWSEGSREREDWMAEVKDNIRPGVEMAGSRSVRRDVRSVGWRRGLRMLRRWVEGNEGD